MNDAISAGMALKMESECIIRDPQGNVKSCLYEVNDYLCGFPVLGILEKDRDGKVLMHEIRVSLDDDRVLIYYMKGWAG